ncbi:MAG: phosphoglucosamine mutase [Candidatus Calescibacterium sp.]|nr:phosphoglucosamine mutase [Candidatus Calescibacterium sp.]MCX7733527.1 phosphoglucosamine mutase [bacterium]MDW8087240.1 phosphoglucosamine mutase [Candidatus Calescibacterium sp.]
MNLFGTDGIRFVVEGGKVNSDLLYSPFLISRIAYATSSVFGKGKYVLVWDTRSSSSHISYIFSSTLSSFGLKTFLSGVLPTPAVSSLILLFGFDGGFSVSASHNPPEFNGIKFFLKDGMKADELTERKIEDEFIKESEHTNGLSMKVSIDGVENFESIAFSSYVSFIQRIFPKNFLRGIKLVVDCSNGATYKVAPHIFSLFSAELDVVGDKPDGKNINVDVGSENPQKALSRSGDFKIIFDGDGDRVIIGDSYGNLYDGDHIISLLAKFMKDEGKLRNGVVGTILSNKALEDFVSKDLKLKFERVQVGDRNIAYKMKEINSNLGGEESGHIILSDVLPTGDGIIAALQTLFYVLRSGKELKDLVISKYYQAKGKVNVSKKESLDSFEFLKKISEEVERLGGRAIVRYSGTEPVLRIMVEHPDKEVAEKYKDILVDEFHSVLK